MTQGGLARMEWECGMGVGFPGCRAWVVACLAGDWPVRQGLPERPWAAAVPQSPNRPAAGKKRKGFGSL